MELKRFKCSDRSSCTFEQSCTRLPVEIHGDAPIDILFVTEFPGKSEAEEETPFVGKFMSSARACVQHLSKKYGFTYAFTSLHKSRKTRFGDAKRPFSSMEIASCAKCVFEREVEHLQPRIIMGFGEMAEEYLGDHKVESIFVESGCIRTSRKIKGRTYDYITSVHPSWCVGQLDPNALGIVYDDIETAALYVKKGVDLRIPDIFESVLLKTIEDVKRVLIELKSKATYIAVDTEDCNLHRVYNNRMLSVQLCADGHTGYVIPLLHYDSPFVGKDVERVIKMLKTFFTTKKTKCKGYVFVNAKYDYHQFFREFHIFQFNAPIIDCSYNEYCLEENLARIAQTKVFPNRQGPYSLYTMSYKRGFTYYKTTGSKERRDILEKIPLSEWEGYAGADAVATFNIWKSQLKRAKALGVLSDFKKEAITLFNHKVRSIVYTEHCGMATDTNVLRDLYNPRTSVLLRAMDDIVREMNAMPSVQALNKRMQKSSIGFSGSFLGTVNAFQPTKRIQLEMLFFDILGLEPLGDKLSVDKAFQEEYKKSVPEVAKLAEYNEIATLQKMFVKPIYEMMTPGTALSSPDFYVDNRIRPTFRTDAVTSRLRCVTLDTIVHVDGRLMTMKEVLERWNPYYRDSVGLKLKIDTPTNIRNALYLMYMGKKNVIKLHTDIGNQIGATPTSRILVLTPSFQLIWKRMMDVKVGDTLCGIPYHESTVKSKVKLRQPEKAFLEKATRKIECVFPKYMNTQLASIMGYLCAEGSGLTFGLKDKSIFDKFITAWEHCFGFSAPVVEKRKTSEKVGESDFYLQYVSNSYVSNFFDLNGYDVTLGCKQKRVPYTIRYADKECIKSFLRAYIEGDGWSTKHSRVCICTTSAGMAYDLQQLILKLGVVSYVRETSSSYYIDISGKNCDTFMSVMGNDLGEKGKDVKKSSEVNGGKLNRIPFILSVLPKHVLGYLDSKVYGNNLRRNSISDRFLYELKQKHNPIYRVLRFLLENNAYFAKVTDINKGYEEVADFTVSPYYHRSMPEVVREGSFIANGLVIHNCEKPNLQQRPARGSRIAPILSMYNCKPGRAIVKLDFSTFEVRGLGFISQDDNMVKLFREMHRIKEDFRKDPYVYAEEGYTSKKERLTTSLKALKKNKSAYKLLDGDQKKEALSKLEEEISGLEKELEQLEYDYKHNPIKLSMEVRKWKTDFHRRSAALFNNISIEEVSPSQRQGAKGFVFGSMYGRGEQSIANELGISLEEATAIKAKFQANMPDATGWLEASADYASKHLCVKSPLGTIRHLWGYLRGEKGITSKMDRLAQNSIIQGMCSNMTLVGISHLLDFIFECKKAKYQTSDDEAWFTTNIVHDSAEMEIPIEDVFFVCLNFEEYFTSKLEAAILEEFGFEIKLPLEVDFTVGSTYANTKDWDGSKLHLKKLQKWVIEECGKRDGVDYSHLYKKAIRKKLSDFIGDDEAA